MTESSSRIILAIDTSTATGSLAVARGQERIFTHSFISNRSHNCDLFEPLESALQQLEGQKLDQILIGTGPGSYGGTRVGIAAAQGISAVHHCPISGIQSFEAIEEAQEHETSWIIGDARRSQYYIAELIRGELQTEDHQLYTKEEFQEKIDHVLAHNHPIFSVDAPDRFNIFADNNNFVTQVVPQAHLIIKRWNTWSAEEQETRNKQVVEPAYLSPPHITISQKQRRFGKPV